MEQGRLAAIEGIEAKLARALEHLLVLDDDIDAYWRTDPVGVQRQVQPDPRTSVFAMVVDPPPPRALAIQVGEIVHQLRSALDHVANRLVHAAGNRPTRRTAFPILLEAPGSLTIDGGVTPEALKVVQQLQPYNVTSDPEGHPLAILNGLWNQDKHRSLVLTATSLRGSQIFVGDPTGQSLVGGQFQPGPIRDDGIIGMFQFADSTPHLMHSSKPRAKCSWLSPTTALGATGRSHRCSKGSTNTSRSTRGPDFGRTADQQQ